MRCVSLTRLAHTAWNTRLRLPLGITDRVASKRALRCPRRPPPSAHVRLSSLSSDLSNRQRPHAYQTHLDSVALWEFMSRFTLPFCSALPHPPSSSPSSTGGSPTPESQPSLPPITATTSIIDLGGVSLGLMWSLRRHLQHASELATAHYPETLHTIAVVNAPAFFPVVWSWIKVRRPRLSIFYKKDASPSASAFAGLPLGLVR
jgi:hypothetical protein